jgi:uncharacterized membrane protein YhaH (DUF805 family)
MQYLSLAFKKAFDFRSRSTRAEYWYFVLFNFIFAIAAMVLDRVLGTTISIETFGVEQDLGYGYIYILNALVFFIPGLSLAVRRLHDVGKSGWMLFIILIPLIGAIWLLVLAVKDSQPGENKWGPNPKGVPAIDGDLLRM